MNYNTMSIKNASIAFKKSSYELKTKKNQNAFFFALSLSPSLCWWRYFHTQQIIQIFLMDWVQIHHTKWMKSCARHENFPEFFSDEKVLFRKRSLAVVVFIPHSVAGLTTSPNQHTNFKFFSTLFFSTLAPHFLRFVSTLDWEIEGDRVKKIN